MATPEYYAWRKAGSPWRKAEPVAYMEAYARAHGITFLGTLGNDDHLMADFPEDHTPFSYTAWPVPLSDYVVCAIDLANERGLGAAILRDARAGTLPWLKYMNMAGKSYAYSDGFQAGYDNGDQHIHLSIFSDETWTNINGYDPLGGGPTGGDMLPEDLNQENYDNYPGVPAKNTIKTATALASTERRAYEAAMESIAANKKLQQLLERPAGVVELTPEAEERIAAKLGAKLDLLLSELKEFRQAIADAAGASSEKITDRG